MRRKGKRIKAIVDRLRYTQGKEYYQTKNIDWETDAELSA